MNVRPLRESLVIEPTSDFSAIILRWPVEYARYLWERGYIPGRRAGTVQRWDRAAIRVVKPLVVEAFAAAVSTQGWSVS